MVDVHGCTNVAGDMMSMSDHCSTLSIHVSLMIYMETYMDVLILRAQDAQEQCVVYAGNDRTTYRDDMYG